MNDASICTLPGGYLDPEGRLHRLVELAPLSGRDEELLTRPGRPAAELVTEVLSGCLRRVGTIAPVAREVARDLLVGDRQYLLLKLREATFGGRIEATVRCPWPGCGAKVDVDFAVADVPVAPLAEPGPLYALELPPEAAFEAEDGSRHREVGFRLPTGADQEALAAALDGPGDEAEALALLLERCVRSIGPFDPAGGERVRGLSARARLEIERRMEELAPAVELTMEARCPECERQFWLPFELQDFFFGELRIGQDLLYRELHYLAYHYHWSEAEILGMPREKRRRYIEILADELEGRNRAVHHAPGP
jgi:hypothetical protein